jgi:hypothetical protein
MAADRLDDANAPGEAAPMAATTALAPTVFSHSRRVKQFSLAGRLDFVRPSCSM